MRSFFEVRVASFIFLFFMAALVGQIAPTGAETVGVVKIGPTVVFRFYNDGVHDPVERARKVTARIEGLLNSSLDPNDVWIRQEDHSYVIYWGSEGITTVDQIQARKNGTTPKKLADTWAANLKKALSNNNFFLIPSHVVIPPYKKTVVKIGGVIKGPIIKESEQGSVNVRIDQENDRITVQPTAEGKSKVVFRRGGVRTTLTIAAEKPPAEVPDSIEARVVGNPAPASVLRFVAKNAVRTRVKVKPGAKMEICSPIDVPEKLGKGKMATVEVPVRISHSKSETVKSRIFVKITNTGSGFDEIKTLLVSDRPEVLNTDGILFKDKIHRGEPARLLYYHKNGSRKKRIIWVELKNKSNKPIKLLMSGALAGPSRWGITVGHMAAIRFLETHRDGIAYSITVPAGETKTLVQVEAPWEQVACGYMHLQITEGSDLEIYVKNSEEFKKAGVPLPVLTQPFDPFKIHPKGKFTPANLDIDAKYTVGQEEEGALVIGKAPWLIDPVTGEPNNGNYGVFYRFKLKLHNPTSKRVKLGFYLMPENAKAMGSFIIDGKLYETEIARKPGRLLFATKEMNPGEKGTVNLLTTPEGGSYYPTRVIIEPMPLNEGEEVESK